MTLTIPNSAQTKDFINGWRQFNSLEASWFHMFHMCASPKSKVMNITENERVYVIGEKPSGTISANLTITDGGQNYPVFTTNALQTHGLGYILRWRTATAGGVYGPWRIPGNTWPTDTNPDISIQPRFYQAILGSTNCGSLVIYNVLNGFASFSDWVAVRNISDASCFFFSYGVELEFRYVMIQNAVDVYNSQLDSSTQTVTTDIAVFKPRPQASHPLTGTVKQTITIHYPPWGTCTTGTVLVPFGAVNETELPSVTSTSTPRPFAIELTNCPRVNIGYSFVAPVGIGYDDATGVVDLDSTQGNAEGVGIQIRHRNDPVYGNNTIVFNPSNYTSNPSYVRNWPQCESQGTCINNPSTGVNHSIPMQAAVYRKGNVTPGKINASLLVHIVYP